MRPRRLAALLAALGLPLAAQAQLDALELRLSRQFEVPLRWLDADASRRLAGPAAPAGAPRSRVRLNPGEALTLAVPAGETLRLHREAAPIDTRGLHFAISNGSGLFVEATPQHARGARDVLIDTPDDGLHLVRIAHRGETDERFEAEVYLSQRQPRGEIARYRRVHELPGRRASLRPADQPVGRPHHAVAAGAALRVRVAGGERLRLDGRVAYGPLEASGEGVWRIAVFADGAPLAQWSLPIRAEQRQPLMVDEAPALLGRPQQFAFTVPEEIRELSIVSSRAAWLRLLELEPRDYLLPALNAPAPGPEALPEEGLALRLEQRWRATLGEADAVLADQLAEPLEIERAARRLAEDNRRRDGGLLAAQALARAAAARPDSPPLAREADEMASRHSFFRDLLPHAFAPHEAPRRAWFVVPRPVPSPHTEGGLSVATRFVRELVAGMPSAQFLRLPPGTVLDYRLPERPAQSELELVLAQPPDEAPTRLWLQFDDAPPRALDLARPSLPGAAMATTRAEAALTAMRLRFGDAAGSTLDGAFAALAEPAPLIAAANARLPLPATVQRIRVWLAAGETPWVALRYRAARSFGWQEADWRSALHAVEAPALLDALRTALAPAAPAGGNALQRELDSHLQPLARALASHARQFAADLPPLSATGSGPPADLLAAGAQAAAGRWLPALEALAGDRGPEANWLRVAALERLGEPWLAERLLRQAMLLEPAARVRARAQARLAERYREAGDTGALRTLLAAAWLRDFDPEAGAALAQALVEDGEEALGLAVALLLPPAKRPLEALLEASLREGWAATFEDTLAALSSAQAAWWRGYQALREGRRAEAEAAWQHAGESGRAWRAALAAADAIPLEAGAGRDAAIAQWLDYHPGPRRWRDAAAHFYAAAGAASVYSIDRDLRFTALRASAAAPARLRVLGPLRLRIEARPVHAAASSEPLDGWLHVIGEQRSWREPIIANPTSPGLALDDPQRRVGRALRRELSLGAGWHTLEIHGGAHELLVRAEISEPALALPLFARPVWAHPPAAPAAPPGEPLRSGLGDCAGCLRVITETGQGASGHSVRALRLRRSLLEASHAHLAPPPLPAPRARPEGTVALAELLAPPPAEQARERLIELLWHAERQPADYPAVLVAAEAIVEARPGLADAPAMIARLRQRSGWRGFDNVRSAGVRALPAGAPESPALRVRHALLEPLADRERRLSGDARLVLFFDSPAALELSLALAVEQPLGLAAEALAVETRFDREPPARRVLAPDTTHTLRLRIPAGRHALRVAMVEPRANQFLRIGIGEGAAAQLLEAPERFYQVARHDEPLRAAVPGPAWLRIDQWRPDGVSSDYRRIDAAWGELELRPAAGETEALYRLALRETLAEAAAPPPPPPPTDTSRPLPAGVALPVPAPAGEPVLRDGLPLGGQQDGTWTVALARLRTLEGDEGAGSGVRRFDEAAATYRLIDRDTQWRSTLLARHFPAGNPSLGLRAGWHRGRGEWPLDVQLQGALHAQTLRLATVEGDRDGALHWAAHASASLAQSREIGPKAWHRPRLSLFARELSLAGDPAVAPGRGRPLGSRTAFAPDESLDPEVYSRYRAEHRWGISIGDALHYLPWLDSEGWLSAGLTSNPGLALWPPDRANLEAGWRQLIGPLIGELRLSHAHYFADPRRAKAADDSKLALELGWERWSDRLQRHELGIRYQRELGGSAWGLGLFWQLSLGNGRGFADFRAGEAPFAALRERRQPVSANHVIEVPQR